MMVSAWSSAKCVVCGCTPAAKVFQMLDLSQTTLYAASVCMYLDCGYLLFVQYFKLVHGINLVAVVERNRIFRNACDSCNSRLCKACNS